MAAVFPTTVPTTDQLRTLVNNCSTSLTSDITNAVTTIPADDTSRFPTAGDITIGEEIITYTGKTGTSFTGCTRGAHSSTAVAHVGSDIIHQYYIAYHHNQMRDELIAVAQNISDRFGLGTNVVIQSGKTFSSASALTISAASTSAISVIASLSADYEGVQIENTETANAASGARLLIKSGGVSAGDPQIRFRVGTVTDWVAGIDNSDSDNFKISASATLGSSDMISISTAGGIGLLGAAPATNQVVMSVAAVGSSVLINMTNSDNTNAASHAAVRIAVGGSSGGDPYIRFNISGGSPADWSLGIDNSDSDKFKIVNASTIATSSLLTLDSSGNLTMTGNVGAGVSSTSARLHASDATDLIQILESSWANSSGSSLYLRHTRGTGGAHTVVVSGDTLRVRFQGSDGTAYRTLAEVVGIIDGTPGASDMPGRLSFYTTPDGSATGVENFRINNAGHVGINSGKSLFLDGVSLAGDTYIAEASANLIRIVTGGTVTAAFSNDAMGISAAGKFYLDGTALTGDTYIAESAANVITMTAGGTDTFRISSTNALVSVLGARDFAVPSARLIYLDGGGDTYLTESAANVIDIFTNNAKRLQITASGSIVPGTAALATTATDGFIYLESCAGAPTGVPTTFTGRLACVYDSTNNKLYVYNGAWKGIVLA